MDHLRAALDRVQPDVLFLAVFVAALAAGRLRAVTRLVWHGRFFDGRTHLLFGYPLEASILLVALPLIFLLPGQDDTPTPAAVALVSAFCGLFAVDYLRAHQTAARLIYTPEGAQCPFCVARRRRRRGASRIAAHEAAQEAAEGKEVTP